MSAETSNRDITARQDRFPEGIPYIVGNECAERFSFYGMRAILYIYLTSLFLHFVPEAQLGAEALNQAKADATAVTHLFMAGVFAFPMIGAILADRLLGKYRVILWVSMIYVSGHGMLAVAGRFGVAQQFTAAEWGMYIGLALVAVGSGGIKPCVSANVGDQFVAGNGHLIDKVFQIFYFIINYGSFFATLLIPLLKEWFGAEVAFAVPGGLMAVATLVFWLGRNRFTKIPANPGGRLGRYDFFGATFLFGGFALMVFSDQVLWLRAIEATVSLVIGLSLFITRQRIEADDGFLAVLLWSFRHQHLRQPGNHFFDPARQQFGAEAGDGPPAVLRIMVVFAMVSMFRALFEQHSSTWIEQAKQMELTLPGLPLWIFYFVLAAMVFLALYGGGWLMLWISNVRIPAMVTRLVLLVVVAAGALCLIKQSVSGARYNLTLLPSQIQALNPLMVMLIIPGLSFLAWRPLERRKVRVTPLQKMTLGMFLTALAFVVAAILQLHIQNADHRVHVLWQVIQYFVITTAEVLVSAEGLAFAYTQAPRRMKSTIMGFWLLCGTVGNLLVAMLAPLQKSILLSSFFFLFAGLMVLAATIFAVLAYTYKGKEYLQHSAPTNLV